MKRKTINKKIGIIGGVGPQATERLYHEIIELAQKKYCARNNDDYPHLIIESVPIPDFISDKEKIDGALKILIKSARNLEKAGATRLYIACNTIHILFKQINNEIGIPLFSLIDLVSNKVKELRIRNAGIMASSTTLKSEMYQNLLTEKKLSFITPSINETKIIDVMIRRILSGEKNTCYSNFTGIIENLIKRGADRVVLSCTELPLLVRKANNKRIISSISVLAEHIVNYYYS